jgi:hypothetical protein
MRHLSNCRERRSRANDQLQSTTAKSIHNNSYSRCLSRQRHLDIQQVKYSPSIGSWRECSQHPGKFKPPTGVQRLHISSYMSTALPFCPSLNGLAKPPRPSLSNEQGSTSPDVVVVVFLARTRSGTHLNSSGPTSLALPNRTALGEKLHIFVNAPSYQTSTPSPLHPRTNINFSSPTSKQSTVYLFNKHQQWPEAKENRPVASHPAARLELMVERSNKATRARLDSK